MPQFNQAMEMDGTIVVDIRNAYESEVGRFQDALCPDVDSFSEELPVVKEMLEGKEDNKILLYCTGGIRCEKTSAWLKHHGYKDVNQLHGGIIDYVRQVKEEGLECKFVGKNFVFDERLGERISDHVIANCHVCGEKADQQYNCKWQGCHTLFVCCDKCYEPMNGCCTQECKNILEQPEDVREALKKEAKAPSLQNEMSIESATNSLAIVDYPTAAFSKTAPFSSLRSLAPKWGQLTRTVHLA